MSQAPFIREAFFEARSRAPDFSIHKLAGQLGVSQGQIQAARLGHGVTGLALTPCDLVMRLPSLGALEITTTSPHARLKSKSPRLRIAGLENAALSLRMLLPHWYWACLSEDAEPAIEVFDRYGRMLHRISSAPEEPRGEGWSRLARLQWEREPAFTDLVEVAPAPSEQLPRLVDEWKAMRDETEFSALLRRHHLRRIDAYRAVENRYAQRMTPRCFVSTLERAARARRSLRLSVANAGGVHSHAALYGHVGERADHIEALGGGACLSLERSAIAETWLISQPSADGIQCRLEAFGRSGRMIAQLADAAPSRLPVSTPSAMSLFG